MKDYIIMSENSSDHWPFFDTKDKNVLDIGCGIWYTRDMEETSPIYFGRDANLVVAIDANEGDIIKYKEYVEDNQKYLFEKVIVNDVQQIRDLIETYSINALKSDIEGHEKILLDLTTDDFKNITDIAIEYHTLELKEAFLSKIPEWGFEIEVLANFKATPPNLGVIFAKKMKNG